LPDASHEIAPVAMFDAARPWQFHVELTDKCNAGCPMCPRTDHMNGCVADRSKVFNVELTLEDFRRSFDDETCARTSDVILSGAYGDPIAASQCLEIVEHLTARGVRVAMSTNGGLRRPDWWRRLGEAFRASGSRLELHVDGLREVNALYRVNTRFERIMANAEAFLATGAEAEWHFILFRHNEHQLAEARALADRMGFRAFVAIDSIRFSKSPSFDYVLPTGERRTLEPPTLRVDETLGPGKADREDANAVAPPRIGGVSCKSAAVNRAYVSAHGIVSACCWMTGSDEEAALNASAGVDPDERHDLHKRPLAEILADEPFASIYAERWGACALETCLRKCAEDRRNIRHRVERG